MLLMTHCHTPFFYSVLPTTAIYTLSLHDALPILADGTELREHVKAVRGTADNPMPREEVVAKCRDLIAPLLGTTTAASLDRKSTRLNSSHVEISYAVFCLKKKKRPE